MRFIFPSVLLVLATSCANGIGGVSASSTSSGSSSSGSSGQVDAGPPCTAGVVAPLSFQDKTDVYGLAGLGVKGNRMAAPDLDEDGFPDLVIHTLAVHQRTDFAVDAGPTAFKVRVLMNRPREGGGRKFVEATQDSGLLAIRNGPADKGRAAHFAAFADLNDDGHLDVFSGTYGDPTSTIPDPGDRSEVLFGDGHGHFRQGAALPAPLQGVVTVTGAAFTDMNLDGHLEVYVGHWYKRYGYSAVGMQNRLLVNRGDETFYEAAAGVGLGTTENGFNTFTNHRPTYGTGSCDVDGDGRGDLFTSAYGRQLNQLFLHGEDNSYRDVGVPSGFASDTDEDFTTNENYKCHCVISGGCTAPQPRLQCPAQDPWDTTTDQAKWRLGGNTFSTVCADFNNDGRMDLFNAEIHHWWAGTSSDSTTLLLQTDSENGEPRFTRPNREMMGLAPPHPTTDWNEGGIMATAGDLDNDGRMDVVVGYSDYPDQFGLVYHQKSDGTFEEVGAAAGFHHPCLSGVALLDVDRDGDLDVVAGSGTARDCAALWPNGNEVHFYENTSGQSSGVLQLVLEGAGAAAGGANKSAIGARVTADVAGLQVVRDVTGSFGHFGQQNDMVVSVGLGTQCKADITVRWPNGDRSSEQFTGLTSGTRWRIKEGGTPEAIP